MISYLTINGNTQHMEVELIRGTQALKIGDMNTNSDTISLKHRQID